MKLQSLFLSGNQNGSHDHCLLTRRGRLQWQECAEGRDGECSPAIEKPDATLFIMNMSFNLAGTWHVQSLQLLSFAQLFPLIPIARYKQFDPSS